MLISTAAASRNTRKVEKILFASSFLSSPFLLATSADMATLDAMKRDRPRNFGWVVSPTAATA